MMFDAWPVPDKSDASPRRTGVEIEFAGLTEAEAARVVETALGGVARECDKARWHVDGTRIGDVEVYLDIFLRDYAKSALRDIALAAGRDLVPVEIVTRPLDREGLILLEGLRGALQEAGALGSGAGLLNGFGVHLNIEVAGETVADFFPTFMAYALCEDRIREVEQINRTRRLLPFTDRYPRGLLMDLVNLWPDARLESIIAAYLVHAPSRNFGLDMLPLFAFHAPEQVKARMGPDQPARPAFHFRLPDSLIDDPDWTLDQPWRSWLTVERCAVKDGLIDDLIVAWRLHADDNPLLRPSWAETSGRIMDDHGVWQ